MPLLLKSQLLSNLCKNLGKFSKIHLSQVMTIENVRGKEGICKSNFIFIKILFKKCFILALSHFSCNVILT